MINTDTNEILREPNINTNATLIGKKMKVLRANFILLSESINCRWNRPGFAQRNQAKMQKYVLKP